MKVAISLVRPNPVALRSVDKDDEEYQNLSDSVGRLGILNALSVREKTDPQSNETYYELIDGLHRYSSAVDNGLTEVPIDIKNVDDATAEEIQLVANLANVKTKASDVTKHLLRMMARYPLMTNEELGEKISQSGSYVAARLGLNKLDKKIMGLVDGGDINISNAIALSRLPKEEQFEYLDAAQVDQPAQFKPTVDKRVKELAAAAKAGRPAGGPTFAAVAHVRKKSEIEARIAETSDESVKAVLTWVLSLDAPTVQAAEAKWNASQKAKAEERKAAKIAAAEKKSQEAAATAAKLREEAGVEA